MGDANRAIVFRGWGDEADNVRVALTTAGVLSDAEETMIPSILGGVLIVSEVFVDVTDLTAARQVIMQCRRSRCS
jgi:hypothetical protein